MEYCRLPERARTWQLQRSGRWPGHHICIMSHQNSKRKQYVWICVIRTFYSGDWSHPWQPRISWAGSRTWCSSTHSARSLHLAAPGAGAEALTFLFGPRRGICKIFQWNILGHQVCKNFTVWDLEFPGPVSGFPWPRRCTEFEDSQLPTKQEFNFQVFLETNIYLSIVVHILDSLV